MCPFDKLTIEDKEVIAQYITSYTGCEVSSQAQLEKILAPWSKAKHTLLKALGGELRVSIPISLTLDSNMYYNSLREIYTPFDFYDLTKKDKNVGFIHDLYNFIVEGILDNSISHFTALNIQKLFAYKWIKDGSTGTSVVLYGVNGAKVLKIPANTKIVKAIRKSLKFINYDNFELFEEWRNQISNLTMLKEVKANFVISIHPMDYFTMSDNNCGWRSCMSWADKGGYSAGVIEMLNSNVAVVCYLESSKPFYFNGYKLSNKTWRCLYYIHKEILLSGKSYPYNNHQITRRGLDIIANLVEKNLGWRYQYKNQEYRDLQHYRENAYVRESLPHNRANNKHHNIFVYTYGMFNDLIEDSDTTYWCYRNYVKKSLFISLSGAATCMMCGEPLNDEVHCYFDEDYVSHSSVKRCAKCDNKYHCNSCHRLRKDVVLFNVQNEYGLHIKICEECIRDYLFFTTKDQSKAKLCIPKTRVATYIKMMNEEVKALQSASLFDSNFNDRKYRHSDFLSFEEVHFEEYGTISYPI